MHLVKEMKSGKVVAKCGAETDTAHATIWYTEATCVKCRPYEYVKDDDGNVVQKARYETKVIQRRPKRSV